VKVLSEWVRFRIFDERSKQQKELKAPKGLLAPPFTIVVVQEEHHRARGPLTKGYHAKGTSTKGGFECAQQSCKSHSPQLATQLPGKG
jgi:hypothetical protein